MTVRCITGSVAEVSQAVAIADKAMGYPRRGRHVGGGVHVAMPETWDGIGECPPGWTRSCAVITIEKATGVAYAAIEGLELEVAKPENSGKLTPVERASLDLAFTKAQQVDLDSVIEANEVAAAGEPVGADSGNDTASIAAAVIGGAAVIAEVLNQLGVF